MNWVTTKRSNLHKIKYKYNKLVKVVKTQFNISVYPYFSVSFLLFPTLFFLLPIIHCLLHLCIEFRI